MQTFIYLKQTLDFADPEAEPSVRFGAGLTQTFIYNYFKMFQGLWLFDFLGLFLGRLLLAFVLFLESLRFKKENKKLMAILNFILSVSFLLGAYSSLGSILLIIFEIFKIFKYKKLENALLKISIALIILFVGPGFLSVDRFFNIRW